MLELGAAGREELFADLDVIVHRPAHVEKHQHLDRVVALGPHVQIQPARVAGGGGDRFVEVQLLDRPFAREATQAAQRDLDVAGADLDAVVQIAELALLPHLHSGAIAGGVAPDANAFRVVAVVAKGRCAACAYPFAAALVASLLLFKSLAELVHQAVPAELFESRFFRRAQMLGRQRLEPVFGQIDVEAGDFGDT